MSRQSYYRSAWRKKRCKELSVKVISMVCDIRRELPRVGTRKLYYILHENLSEIGVGRDKLFNILKANGMLIKPARSYRMTTNSKHMFHKHRNLILGLTPSRPEQVWAGDITYIGNKGKHRYLSLITDVYSKKIV